MVISEGIYKYALELCYLYECYEQTHCHDNA